MKYNFLLCLTGITLLFSESWAMMIQFPLEKLPVFQKTEAFCWMQEKMRFVVENNNTDAQYMLQFKDRVTNDLIPPHTDEKYANILFAACWDTNSLNYCIHASQGNMDLTVKTMSPCGHGTFTSTLTIMQAYAYFLNAIKVKPIEHCSEKLSESTQVFRINGKNFIVDMQGSHLNGEQIKECLESAFKPVFYLNLLDIDHGTVTKMKKQVMGLLLLNKRFFKQTNNIIDPQVIKSLIIPKICTYNFPLQYDKMLGTVHDNMQGAQCLFARIALPLLRSFFENYSQWFKQEQQKMPCVVSFDDVRDIIKRAN